MTDIIVENEQFSKSVSIGTRVRAKTRVYDCGPDHDASHNASPGLMCGKIHADTGEEGVVEHVQEGFMPTVRFDRTGTATCVSAFEVEVV